MKRKLAFFLSLSMILGIFTACGGDKPAGSATPAPTQSEVSVSGPDTTAFPEMHLQLGHINASTDTDQYQKLATTFANKVNEYTGGAVTIDVLANSELGGELDMLNGMALGTIDICIITNGYYATINPHSMITEMPFMFANLDAARDFCHSDINKGIWDELYELGYKVLATGEGGFHNFCTQKPIKTVEDLKGMKYRVMEQENMLMTFEALGANPIPMAFSECYTAVQQKVIDGMILPVASFYAASYYEIFANYTLSGIFYNPINLSCSRSFWESLSPEMQEVFQRAADEARAEQLVWYDAMMADLYEKIEASGCSVDKDFDNTEFVKTIEEAGVWDYFVDKYIGEELWAKARAFCDQY